MLEGCVLTAHLQQFLQPFLLFAPGQSLETWLVPGYVDVFRKSFTLAAGRKLGEFCVLHRENACCLSKECTLLYVHK